VPPDPEAISRQAAELVADLVEPATADALEKLDGAPSSVSGRHDDSMVPGSNRWMSHPVNDSRCEGGRIDGRQTQEAGGVRSIASKDSESRIEVVDWARGSEADAEECVDRGEIPFGRSGPACRQGVDSGDGGRRVEVVHECGAQPIEDAGGSR
jgi:hypothetical protein